MQEWCKAMKYSVSSVRFTEILLALTDVTVTVDFNTDIWLYIIMTYKLKINYKAFYVLRKKKQ